MIYNEIAKVISNNEIAENIYEAVLFSPKISHESKPGQFINILPEKKMELCNASTYEYWWDK